MNMNLNLHIHRSMLYSSVISEILMGRDDGAESGALCRAL